MRAHHARVSKKPTPQPQRLLHPKPYTSPLTRSPTLPPSQHARSAVAAPIAHVAVSCYRHVKTQNGKRALIAFGVVGATFGSVFMRLYLMKHAGYPCGDDQHNDRIGTYSFVRRHTLAVLYGFLSS